MKKSVVFEGGVNKVSTLSDGSLSINIHTQELPDDTMMKIFNLRKKPGMVMISSDSISQEEVKLVEEYTSEFDVGKGKTPSQRLRSVLYVVWEQGDQKYDFPIWYETQMERIINKSKIITDDIGFQLMFGIIPDPGEDNEKTKRHHKNYKIDCKRYEMKELKQIYR